MTDKSKDKKHKERVELDKLLDIKMAIDEIQGHPKFPEGKLAWYEDKYYRGYCERQLAILGEAASKLASEHGYEVIDPETPWPLIRGLRNVLVHVYWQTDKEILWKIIEIHLPEFKKKVLIWIENKEYLLQEASTLEQGERKEGKLSRKLRDAVENEPPSDTIA